MPEVSLNFSAASLATAKAGPRPSTKAEEARASPKETAADRRRIKELERELRRKDKALAETAALLVLSKKLEAVLPGGEDA